MTLKMRLLWCVVFALLGSILGFAFGQTYNTGAMVTTELAAAILVGVFLNLLFCPPYAILELSCFFIGEAVTYLVTTAAKGFNFGSAFMLTSIAAGLAAYAIIYRSRKTFPSS